MPHDPHPTIHPVLWCRLLGLLRQDRRAAVAPRTASPADRGGAALCLGPPRNQEQELARRTDVELTLLERTHAPQGYGFVLPRGSARTHDVNVALLATQEAGVVRQARQRWLPGTPD